MSKPSPLIGAAARRLERALVPQRRGSVEHVGLERSARPAAGRMRQSAVANAAAALACRSQRSRVDAGHVSAVAQRTAAGGRGRRRRDSRRRRGRAPRRRCRCSGPRVVGRVGGTDVLKGDIGDPARAVESRSHRFRSRSGSRPRRSARRRWCMDPRVGLAARVERHVEVGAGALLPKRWRTSDRADRQCRVGAPVGGCGGDDVGDHLSRMSGQKRSAQRGTIPPCGWGRRSRFSRRRRDTSGGSAQTTNSPRAWMSSMLSGFGAVCAHQTKPASVRAGIQFQEKDSSGVTVVPESSSTGGRSAVARSPLHSRLARSCSRGYSRAGPGRSSGA